MSIKEGERKRRERARERTDWIERRGEELREEEGSERSTHVNIGKEREIST